MSTLIALSAIALIVLPVYGRIRYGKAVSQGSTEDNTVHAIRTANATVIRLYDAVISDILDNQSN